MNITDIDDKIIKKSIQVNMMFFYYFKIILERDIINKCVFFKPTPLKCHYLISKEKKKFSDITQHYEAEFFQDLKSLNCEQPSIVLRVTSHVKEIIQYIERLIDCKQAYVSRSGSVYFNTQAFKIKSFFDTEFESNVDSKG
jgi:cysteinyl-tRNA synthetase